MDASVVDVTTTQKFLIFETLVIGCNEYNSQEFIVAVGKLKFEEISYSVASESFFPIT